MTVFIPKTMEAMRKDPDLPVRIYADGVYDLFHYGHVEQLKQAKQAFKNGYLIVGVVSDSDCLRYKGSSPIMSYEERVRSVQLCSWVDEIVPNPPFYPTVEFVDENKIDLVAHDSEPYVIADNSIEDCYGPFKNLDRFLPTRRTPCVSTTELIERIIKKNIIMILGSLYSVK